MALILTAVSFGYLRWRIEIERSETVWRNGTGRADFSFWPADMVDATGWAAWWWAWGTVILGLLVAGRRPKWLPGSTRTIEKLHRTTSLTVIGMTLAHSLTYIYASTSLQDQAVIEGLRKSFVPWSWGDNSTGNWGILYALLGLYLGILLGLSYYFRQRIGVRTWRFAHRFSILVYILATAHAFVFTSNVWFMGWQRTLLWVLQLPVAALVLYRLLTPLRRSEQLPLKPGELLTRSNPMTALRLGVRLIAAAALVVLVGVLALDRTGGQQRPDEYPTTDNMEHNASGD